jgi:precorrin-8X/cobalt-precorrin-8 methylmutase
MSLFDFYIMVDWSGAMRRRGMRANTIWTAYGGIEAENPKTDSPFSRTEAIHLIHSLIDEQSRKMLRVLLCFNLRMAFPGIFPPRYRRQPAKPMPLLTWQYLSEAIKDDLGTVLHGKPTNRSNRFDVANTINSLLSLSPEAPGPFFGAPHLRQRIRIFLRVALNSLSKQAKDFRVGSQSLTEIPRLNNLRFDSMFATRSAIWPFETGWATKAKWLPDHVSILHAEINPSVREPSADLIKDRGQVRSMWEWARDLDRQELLWFEFARPTEIEPGSPEDIAIQLTEGWILGSSPTVRRH